MVALKAELAREQQNQTADLRAGMKWLGDMARKVMRVPLWLTNESRKLLAKLSGSMTAQHEEVVRVKVLLQYANNAKISSIKRHVGISRPAIYTC